MQIHTHTCTFPFDYFTYHIKSNKNKVNIEYLQKFNYQLVAQHFFIIS